MIDFRWLLAFKKLTYETRKLETLETPIFTLKFTTYLVLTPKCISIEEYKIPQIVYFNTMHTKNQLYSSVWVGIWGRWVRILVVMVEDLVMTGFSMFWFLFYCLDFLGFR